MAPVTACVATTGYADEAVVADAMNLYAGRTSVLGVASTLNESERLLGRSAFPSTGNRLRIAKQSEIFERLEKFPG